MPDMAIKKGKDGRLEVDPEAAKVVKMIFQMAAEGTSFADITRELNRQAIAYIVMSRNYQEGIRCSSRGLTRSKRNTGALRQYRQSSGMRFILEPRIWGKTRCSMHTGHKAVLNDETEWVRLENHHTAIIDRELFEKANEMHPKKKRSVAESRTNYSGKT